MLEIYLVGRACTDGQGGGASSAYLNRLRAVSEEVLDPGTGGGIYGQLVHQDVRNKGDGSL